MQPQQPTEGILHVHSETGTEGGRWALQDRRHIAPMAGQAPRANWSHEGLHVLRDGDFLTIFDKSDPQKIVWHGWIRLRELEASDQATSDGMRIRADQIGIDRAVWERFFLDGHRAKLIPAP